MDPRRTLPLLLALAALSAACNKKDDEKTAPKTEEKKPEASKPSESGGSGLDLASLQKNAPAAPPKTAAPAKSEELAPVAPKPPDLPPPPVPKKSQGPAPPVSPDEISDTEVRMSWSQDEREALDEMPEADKAKEMKKRRMEIFKQRGGVWEEPKKDEAGVPGGGARPEAKKDKDLPPPGLRDILDDLNSSDPEVRARGAESAKRYPDKPTMVRYIAPLLQDEDVELRTIAASTLGVLKSTDGVAPLLALIEKGDKDQVRNMAIKALFDIGGREAVAGLRQIAREGSEPSDRAASLSMLVKLKEVAEVRGVLRVAITDITAEVREQAVIAIREFEIRDYEPNMVGFLKDYSELVQIEAMKTMGAFGTKSAVGPLIKVLTKTDPEADDPQLLQNAANNALELITGVKQGWSPDMPDDKRAEAIDAWRIWYLKNKDQWK